MGKLKSIGTAMVSPLAAAHKLGADALGINLGGEQGEYVTPDQQQSWLYNKFANDYDNQMKLADEGVQKSGLTKDLYGEGGLQSRLNTEEQRLASQGFKLQPEDYEAYGQASGEASRLFGQEQNDIMASLAKRGLASAGSGAAGVAFSGAAGNKNERLAKAQMDIADKRMQNTLSRLQQTRSQMQSLGVQGAGLARNRYQDKGNALKESVDVEDTRNQQSRNMLADKEAAYQPGFGDALKAGLMSSTANIGTAPGKFASSFAGEGGRAAGKSIFG